MELVTYKAENIGNDQRDSIIPIGRLTAEMTGIILGFTGEHDIRMLIADGLLKPLGNPKDNHTKFFAWVDVQAKARDPLWLSKATNCIYSGWAEKNGGRKTKKIVTLKPELEEAA